ncbi:MAG TPA: acyl-CoA dehydrogenase family protein [Chloroflexota bacterium]
MAVTVHGRDVTLDDVLRRAEELVPRVRERASRAEQLRRVPNETMQEFLDAGLFRVLQPKYWGGFELNYGRTQTELCNALGRACGSSAWVQCVVACHAWCLAMFPPEGQGAVWARDANTLIASAFAFTTGRDRPVDGGYYIEGNWQFSSGSNACEWIILGTPIFDGDGRPVKSLWCLVERPNWEVVDTWYAAGLKGSASNDINVNGVFVPEALTLSGVRWTAHPGSALNPGSNYRLPLWSVFSYKVSTQALGIARGAIEAYVEYMRARPERANMTQRQLRIPESAAEVGRRRSVAAVRCEEARAPRTYWRSLAARVPGEASPRPGIFDDALHARGRSSGERCRAHGMLEDTPIQRACRDIHAVANHGANNWDLQAVPYAREVLGLPRVQGR